MRLRKWFSRGFGFALGNRSAHRPRVKRLKAPPKLAKMTAYHACLFGQDVTVLAPEKSTARARIKEMFKMKIPSYVKVRSDRELEKEEELAERRKERMAG